MGHSSTHHLQTLFLAARETPKIFLSGASLLELWVKASFLQKAQPTGRHHPHEDLVSKPVIFIMPNSMQRDTSRGKHKWAHQYLVLVQNHTHISPLLSLAAPGQNNIYFQPGRTKRLLTQMDASMHPNLYVPLAASTARKH